MRNRPTPSFRCIVLASAVTLLATPLSAQNQAAASLDPNALVRRAIQHRVEATQHHQFLRYQLHLKDERHETLKDIVETKDGDVARLIAVGGSPLPPQANQAELDRLDNLLAHPELQEHRHKSEQKDAERIDRLMSLLPDAFLYRFEATEPCASGQCYRLSFTPNPKFSPPDLESDIFRGIAGQVWIDTAQERLARLDAHLIAEVNFGFGVLARLHKGGTILLEQSNIGKAMDNDWEVTGLQVSVTGKALMLKSLSFHIVEDATHFTLAPPNLDYKQAIQLLKSAPAP